MDRILALDIGEKRVGLAISDETNIIALPYKTILSKDLKEELKEICEKENIGKIIIGLPRNMDGTLGYQAKKIQDIAKNIEKDLTLNTDFFDETATSLAAEKRLKERGVDTKVKKGLIDLESATIILEDYLKEHA